MNVLNITIILYKNSIFEIVSIIGIRVNYPDVLTLFLISNHEIKSKASSISQ